MRGLKDEIRVSCLIKVSAEFFWLVCAKSQSVRVTVTITRRCEHCIGLSKHVQIYARRRMLDPTKVALI